MAERTNFVAVTVYGPYDPGDVIAADTFTDDEAKALIKAGAIARVAEGEKPAAVAREAAKEQKAEAKAEDKKS